MDLKNFLKENILDVKGHINSNKIRYNWLDKNYPEIKSIILNETNFLPENSELRERIYCILNNIDYATKCYCGEKIRFKRTGVKGYQPFCSLSCANNSTLVRAKRLKTNIIKYGGASPACSEIVKRKIKETNIKKYKSVTPLQLPKVLKRTTAINLTNGYNKILHGDKFEPLFPIEEYSGNGIYSWRCKACGSEFRNESNKVLYALRCFTCNPVLSGVSKSEIEVRDFIMNLNIKIKKNTKNIITPYELDVYIPSNKIAIEFNGLYWHSSGSRESDQYSKTRHLEKTNLCAEKGIQLLHIFENEWEDKNKRKIWKSIIMNKLGQSKRIYARKCSVKEVSSKEAKQFLENNHLQGSVASSARVGLFYNKKLVLLLTLGKSRFNKRYEWEIHRFTNRRFFNVVGGFSKCFKYFKDNYKPKSIITYADLRYSVGRLYSSNGFEELSESKPNYWYFKEHTFQLFSRVKFQKHKLHKVLENFEPDKTEVDNMYANNYRRIWDCGNKVFVKQFD